MRRLFVVLIVLGSVLVQAQAQAPTSVEPLATFDAKVAEARVLLGQLSEEAVGLSVAVARNGRIVWSDTFGYRDLEQRQPLVPDTLFRIYSVAKPMTAVAVARLLEEGRLDADAPVQRYVPEFPDKGVPITLMQLATHTSGIRHYRDDAEARSQRHCRSVTEALPIFADDPLVHAPGASETYSSWGYVLLSAVLEGATGQRYEQAMRDLVYQPLGLTSLVIDDPTEDVPRRARFYQEAAPGRFSPAEDIDNTCKWGAGAWLGTADDVARFGLTLIDESLLSAPTRQLFLDGRSVYRVQGWSAGAMAFLVVDDTADLSIALLSNAIGETLGPVLQDAVERLRQLFANE